MTTPENTQEGAAPAGRPITLPVEEAIMRTDKTEAPVVATIEVMERKFEVRADGFIFRAAVGGAEVAGRGREALEAQIRKELAKQKVEHKIPVILDIGEDAKTKIVRAILRGKKVGQDVYLFTLASGEKYQSRRPNVIGKGEAYTDDEVAELGRLRTAQEQARRAVQEFEYAHGGAANLWRLIQESENAAGVPS